MTNKICTKCKLSKSVDCFNYRNKAKLIYSSQCKDCNNTAHWNYNLCGCGSKKRIVSIMCRQCKLIEEQEKTGYNKLTLGDKTYNHLKYAKYSYIRYYARKVGEKLGFTKCCNCGYSKHFEICHIKPISSYPPETLLTVINDKSNLIPLCPNCHYEFDHGLLKLEDIKVLSIEIASMIKD